MHTIYIDVLIFTNIFQDFLLLSLEKRILHLKCKYSRLIIGSICGGFFSLVALLPQMNFILSLLTKLSIAIILVLITFGFKNKKIFIKSISTLFIITFLINGGIIMFYLALKPKGMAVINNIIYFNISPLLLTILTFFVYIILYFHKKLFRNQSKSYEIEKVTIIHKKREYIVNCKIDSGCIVKEPFSGSYVIIIEENQLKDIDIDKEKIRIIPFTSLGGEGILKGFKPEIIKIGEKEICKDIYIGLCNNIFKNNIQGLVPQELLKE